MSNGQLITNNWREQAYALFFIEHFGINEIAAAVNKSRETVSRYITDCGGYADEMAFRKERSGERRRDYKRQWDKDNRSNRYSSITGESIRREHELAVLALSRERYYG